MKCSPPRTRRGRSSPGQAGKAAAELRRKHDLALIHQAKKALGIEDDDYRLILERITGKTSAAELHAAQRAAVIAHFRSLGWKPTPAKRRHGRKPTVAQDAAALLNKIEALLSDAGRPWAYADAMAKTMFQMDSIRFCQPAQLHKIVAALCVDQRRRTGQVFRP
jgi:phage gp16-like protein